MSEPQEKPMLTDVFVSGVKRGWGIATGSMLPNVLMAFILIYVLKLTGILDLIGTVCGPVMKVFGLPGEALMVLLAAWLHQKPRDPQSDSQATCSERYGYWQLANFERL